jgi:hypothetical protein
LQAYDEGSIPFTRFSIPAFGGAAGASVAIKSAQRLFLAVVLPGDVADASVRLIS